MTGAGLFGWLFMGSFFLIVVSNLIGAARERERRRRELAERTAEGTDEGARTVLLALYREWDGAWGTPSARPEPATVAIEEALWSAEPARLRAALAALPGEPTPAEELALQYATEREALLQRASRSGARRRLGWIAVGAFLGLFGIAIAWEVSHDPRGAGVPLEEITIREAATRVKEARGRVAVVVFYEADCRCSAMVAKLGAYAARHRDAVTFLPFAYDDDPDDIRDFLVAFSQPFDGVRLLPWKPGQLIGVMRSVGIEIPRRLETAIVAVLDPEGRRVAQWVGQQEAAPVVNVIQKALREAGE